MHLLGRRSFLRGLGLGAGTHLLGAMFRQMLPEALGQPNTRKRFVLFASANGFVHYQNRGTETSWSLHPAMAALAPYKSEMLVVGPLYCPFDQNLHGNSGAVLSMMPSGGPKNVNDYFDVPGGITIDRQIGRRIGKDDPFPAINMGPAYIKGGPIQSHAADGLRQPAAGWTSPIKAFGALMGGTGPDALGLAALNKSVLDYIAGDIATMSTRLAGPERMKLDQYLDAIRGLEQQLSKAASSRCGGTAEPARTLPDTLDPGSIRAFVDIGFTALLCGLTRVVQLPILAFGGPHIRYTWLGDTLGEQSQIHPQGTPQMIDKISAFKYGEIAHMLKRLHDMSDSGSGKMSDSTLVAYVNHAGGEHHNGWNTHGVLLFGKLGGRFRTDRYLTYPTRTHSYGDLWVSVANAMDAPMDTFGAPGHCKGPLPNLT